MWIKRVTGGLVELLSLDTRPHDKPGPMAIQTVRGIAFEVPDDFGTRLLKQEKDDPKDDRWVKAKGPGDDTSGLDKAALQQLRDQRILPAEPERAPAPRITGTTTARPASAKDMED